MCFRQFCDWKLATIATSIVHRHRDWTTLVFWCVFFDQLVTGSCWLVKGETGHKETLWSLWLIAAVAYVLHGGCWLTFKSESSVFGQVCAHKQESEMFVFILLGLSDFSNLFYTTDRSLNQPLTNHRIQHFLQWPVVARWLPTGLYVSLVNPALAHCFCWTSTPRFWCSRGSASQTNWLFYGGHVFFFHTVYDVYTDKKLKFSFLRWNIWFLWSL